MNTGVALYRRAKRLIPGGTQLLSKRPEMFLPDGWPSYYSRAEGACVWDLDGNQYADFVTSGIGACPLGYANPVVDAPVVEAIRKGSMSTLNPPEEVELAELLCELHPWAEMARYTRSGGEAMAVAIRIARAASGRDMVLFSGYHGWHDWYLSTNLDDDEGLDGHLLPGLQPRGVPRELKNTAVGFRFNDVESLKALYQTYKDRVGVVVVESLRNDPPSQTMIEEIARIRQNGVVFVMDEITSGWRIVVGGAHLVFGIEPDIAVFAKGISNGYPLGVIIGKRTVMDAAQSSFISSTYWTERIGPTAGLATIRHMRATESPTHLVQNGRAVRDAWTSAANAAGLSIQVTGIDPLLHFSFVGENTQLAHTVFTALMLKRGYLASNVFYATTAHSPRLIDDYRQATAEVFGIIADSSTRELSSYLPGEVAHSGFARLN